MQSGCLHFPVIPCNIGDIHATQRKILARSCDDEQNPRQADSPRLIFAAKSTESL
ncbi:hypothetical protein FHT78_005414 [Rhizobium sp. BK196]|nr:hypothetical protein [Rhizobium sp. BK196]